MAKQKTGLFGGEPVPTAPDVLDGTEEAMAFEELGKKPTWGSLGKFLLFAILFVVAVLLLVALLGGNFGNVS